MQSKQLQKHHLLTFMKLSLSNRLSWAFAQNWFLVQFMDPEAKSINKKIRQNGKRYFRA